MRSPLNFTVMSNDPADVVDECHENDCKHAHRRCRRMRRDRPRPAGHR